MNQKSKSKPFAFRQRAGILNWKAVTAIDLKNLINEVNISELQSVLDTITFSEVGNLNAQSVENIVKLCTLLQFTIEYLLYSQESQYNLVKRLKHENHATIDRLNDITKKNAGYKEDIKIYQRQIQMLRETIRDLQGTGIVAMNPNKEISDCMVESILRHEKEARENMRHLLHEQRNAFLHELMKLSSNFQLSRDDIEEKLTHHIDNALAKLNKNYSAAPMDAKINLVDLTASHLNVDMFKLKEEQLRTQEQTLLQREQSLVSKEIMLKEQRKKLADLKKELNSRNRSPIQSTSLQSPQVFNCTESLYGLKSILLILKKGYSIQIATAFYNWRIICLTDRYILKSATNARNDESLQQKIQELTGNLVVEKQKLDVERRTAAALRDELEKLRPKKQVMKDAAVATLQNDYISFQSHQAVKDVLPLLSVDEKLVQAIKRTESRAVQFKFEVDDAVDNLANEMFEKIKLISLSETND